MTKRQATVETRLRSSDYDAPQGAASRVHYYHHDTIYVTLERQTDRREQSQHSVSNEYTHMGLSVCLSNSQERAWTSTR